VKHTLLGMFGTSPEILADLGIADPRPRRTLTTDELALAAERAKATRVVRHTLGPKQRLKLKGQPQQQTSSGLMPDEETRAEGAAIGAASGTALASTLTSK